MLVRPLLSDAGTCPSSTDVLATSRLFGLHGELRSGGRSKERAHSGNKNVGTKKKKKQLCRLRFYFINTSRDDMRRCSGVFFAFFFPMSVVSAGAWGRDEGQMFVMTAVT